MHVPAIGEEALIDDVQRRSPESGVDRQTG